MGHLACFLIYGIDPQMLAPMIGGLLFDFVGYSFAAIFIAGWNLVSVIVEYMLLILIYRFVFTSDKLIINWLFLSTECIQDMSHVLIILDPLFLFIIYFLVISIPYKNILQRFSCLGKKRPPG